MSEKQATDTALEGRVELLPCPFCGATDGRLVQAFTRATDTFAYWSVECLDCGCEIADDESQANADTAWNRRAPSLSTRAVEDDRVERSKDERLKAAREIVATYYRTTGHSEGEVGLVLNGAWDRTPTIGAVYMALYEADHPSIRARALTTQGGV